MSVRALLFFTLPLAACGAHRLPHPVYSAQPTSALVPIPSEPPPGRAERVPPQPELGTVWVDGEWAWRRKRWMWIPGRWVVQPEGITYAPWCTVRAQDGSLYFAPSAWRNAKGQAVDPPKSLASASVEAGAVVDPEGNTERTVVAAPR